MKHGFPGKFICGLLCAACLFTGCAPSLTEEKSLVNEDGSVTVGNCLTVRNDDSRLTLMDNKDALAADGLYYATWTAGNCEAFENSDGETVDLYDAQLYLLLSENKNSEDAQKNMDTWLAAARSGYEIHTEEEITCNGQDYTQITYGCVSEDSPYDRGISVFGVLGNDAVCIELTCREGYGEDLQGMLTDFLDSCSLELHQD